MYTTLKDHLYEKVCNCCENFIFNNFLISQPILYKLICTKIVRVLMPVLVFETQILFGVRFPLKHIIV